MCCKDIDSENPDSIRPIVDGFRYKYASAGYPEKALTILGVFDDIDEDQLYGILGNLASMRVSDFTTCGVLTITDALTEHRVMVNDDIEFPTLSKRRTRDYVVEYILRRCHDHIVGNSSEYGYPPAYLSHIVRVIGGHACSPDMRTRMDMDGDIVQIGKVLKAMDVIDRKVDDKRVDAELLRFKRKSKSIMDLERRTGFLTVFGTVDFCSKVTAEDEESMWRCFKELRDSGILPPIPNSKDLVFKVRHLKRLNGVYYRDVRFLVVDGYGAFVHEYAHAFDHAMGRLSQDTCFMGILEEYRTELDAECSKRGIVCDNPGYYRCPTECFARCFEMYVMMLRGPSILLGEHYPVWAYPESPALRRDIRVYFDAICGR